MKASLGVMTAVAIASLATFAVAAEPAQPVVPDYYSRDYEPKGVFIDNPKPYGKYYDYGHPKKDQCFFDKQPFFRYKEGFDVKIKERKVRNYGDGYDSRDYGGSYATLITAKCKIPLYFPVRKKIILYGFDCKLIDNSYNGGDHDDLVMNNDYGEQSDVLYAKDSRFTIKKGKNFAELKCVFLKTPEYDDPDYGQPNGPPVTEVPEAPAEVPAAPPAG